MMWFRSLKAAVKKDSSSPAFQEAFDRVDRRLKSLQDPPYTTTREFLRDQYPKIDELRQKRKQWVKDRDDLQRRLHTDATILWLLGKADQLRAELKHRQERASILHFTPKVIAEDTERMESVYEPRWQELEWSRENSKAMQHLYQKAIKFLESLEKEISTLEKRREVVLTELQEEREYYRR